MMMSPVGAKPMAGGGRTQWKKPSPFLLAQPNTDGGLGLRSGDKDSILTLCVKGPCLVLCLQLLALSLIL